MGPGEPQCIQGVTHDSSGCVVRAGSGWDVSRRASLVQGGESEIQDCFESLQCPPRPQPQGCQGGCVSFCSFFSRSGVMGRPLVHSQFWPWASSHLPGGDSIHLSVICPCIHPSICLSFHPSSHLPTHKSSIHPVKVGCLLWTRNHRSSTSWGHRGGILLEICHDIVYYGSAPWSVLSIPSGQLRGHDPGLLFTPGIWWGTAGPCPFNSHSSCLGPCL